MLIEWQVKINSEVWQLHPLWVSVSVCCKENKKRTDSKHRERMHISLILSPQWNSNCFVIWNSLFIVDMIWSGVDFPKALPQTKLNVNCPTRCTYWSMDFTLLTPTFLNHINYFLVSIYCPTFTTLYSHTLTSVNSNSSKSFYSIHKCSPAGTDNW